jgi:HAD superfamily hydrolase (TIGR01549 family)
MKFKMILFDQDGTVADTLPLIAQAVQNTVKAMTGNDMHLENIVAFFGPSEEGVLRNIMPGRGEEAFQHYLQEYTQLHDTLAPKPFPYIKEMLQHLMDSGLQIGMITGKSAQATAITLRKYGLDRFFSLLETGSPEGHNKRSSLEHILQNHPVTLDDCLYIGDEPSDIHFCREAGLTIASAAWASTAQVKELEELNPGLVFRSMEKLEKWILTTPDR